MRRNFVQGVVIFHKRNVIIGDYIPERPKNDQKGSEFYCLNRKQKMMETDYYISLCMLLNTIKISKTATYFTRRTANQSVRRTDSRRILPLVSMSDGRRCVLCFRFHYRMFASAVKISDG